MSKWISILFLCAYLTYGATWNQQKTTTCYVRSSQQNFPERVQQTMDKISMTLDSKLEIISSTLETIATSLSTIAQNTNTYCTSPTSAEPQTTSSTQSPTSFVTQPETTTESPTTESPFPKGTPDNPARSCNEIALESPSEDYWVYTGNGTVIQVYCNMTRTCCNNTGGWMVLANYSVNVNDRRCPDTYTYGSYGPDYGLLFYFCRRPGGVGYYCHSLIFPVHGIEYSHVCGNILGYQWSSTTAFDPYYQNQSLTIDDPYVEGISITYGQYPRKHIWTLAAARDELFTDSSSCPCIRSDTEFTGVIPPFVGDDYFCATSITSRHTATGNTHYLRNPIWDGNQCGSGNTCCTFNDPPIFCKQLPEPSTDDIELRLCGDGSLPLNTIQIYVR